MGVGIMGVCVMRVGVGLGVVRYIFTLGLFVLVMHRYALCLTGNNL